jgi:hypothetical protein
MRAMHVVPISLRGNAHCFDQDTYVAPSGEAFAIEITNSAFTMSGKPLRGTVGISRASDPARAPVPGRPHMWTYAASKAIFIAPAVTAPDTQTVVVQALEPGRYVLQLVDGWGHEGNAVLAVGP